MDEKTLVYLFSLLEYASAKQLLGLKEEMKKSRIFKAIPLVLKLHTSFFDAFPSPTGHTAFATHERPYRPATWERKRERGKRELCGFRAGCSRSLGQMLAGRFWLCVLSLGLAFIRSLVTGCSAKWAPMSADSSSNPTSDNCGWLQKEEDKCVLLCISCTQSNIH